MGRFLHTTCFFISIWTWGYEDLLMIVTVHFDDKAGSPFDVAPLLLAELPDPRGPVQTLCVLSSFSIFCIKSHRELSRDMSSTRFHTCERFDRCEEVERLGKSVVQSPLDREGGAGTSKQGRRKSSTGRKLHPWFGVSLRIRCRFLSLFKPSSAISGDTRLFLSYKRS